LIKKGDSKIIFIANFTDQEQSFSLNASGSFTDYMTGESDELVSGEEMTYPAWGYQVLVK
jgi:hypothetical protein